MTLLSIQNLSLSFGDHTVVKNVSLSIDKGEMLALVGESGSGKSLTALSVLGLQPTSATVSGNIQLGGQEIIGAPEAALRGLRGKTASMIFQEPMTALNPLHTIEKQIGEILSCHPERIKGESRHNKTLQLLEAVGLSHFKDRLDTYPHQLSGGERQRMMIAMAIANHPQLLIADEPTTAVDVTIQANILKLLKNLQKERQMAMLFITHDLTIVKKLADRVAVMKNGEIVEQGKVADIFAAPKHPYTQLLLSSEPKGEPPPPPPNPQPVMRCEHLKVYFPIKKGVLRHTVGYVKAVDDISITVPESSTLGVVGESGSGKSTLGFALLRLVKSEGGIFFARNAQHETPITNLPSSSLRALRKEMQLVFQDPFSSLNPRMSIAQIIEEGMLVHFPEISELARQTMVDDVLAEVGLPTGIKHRFPHEFSGGQRQRVAIARAVVLRPKFLVLDEPTSALDLTVQTQIIELLKNIQKKYKMSYLFISHDLRVVRAISHQIIVMKNGKIVEAGDTKTLFETPREEYTKALIAAAFLKH